MDLQSLDTKILGASLSVLIFILYHEIQQLNEAQRRTEETLREVLYRLEERYEHRPQVHKRAGT
ncbi:MAG: hypothetical protein H6618_09470 [Deltaproteobacteria bacterium]|nr:hypothetical protein [Deltaproteobacteria bacterium]